jgi:hypothetical protein
MRLPIALALVAALSTSAHAVDSDGTEPDPVLTPGAVETGDLDILCHHKTAERRHTTQSEKNASFIAYGLANHHAGWCAGPHGCSVDHRVPLECGGADVPANLWPETGDGPYNQEDKNRLEGLCKRMICQGKITPAEGQAWFLGDWKAEYDRRFGAISGEK